MSKNKIRFFVSLAIVFAVFTVIAFVIPVPHGAVFWLCYAFGVIALAAQLHAYPKAFAGESPRSKFYGFPLARISTIYLCVQLVLSLAFMLLGLIPVPLWIPVILFVLLLAAAALGFIAADSVKDEVERQDTVHKANVDTMRALQSKSAFIAGQCEDPETKNALDKLAESFRFSDPVSGEALSGIEASLNAQVDELQSAVMEKDFYSARRLCARIEATLADRNRLCKLNK